MNKWTNLGTEARERVWMEGEALYLRCLDDWARWYVNGVWTYNEFTTHADAMMPRRDRPTRSEQSLELEPK